MLSQYLELYVSTYFLVCSRTYLNNVRSQLYALGRNLLVNRIDNAMSL